MLVRIATAWRRSDRVAHQKSSGTSGEPDSCSWMGKYHGLAISIWLKSALTLLIAYPIQVMASSRRANGVSTVWPFMVTVN